MGIGANLKEIGEFDFSKDNYVGEVIILTNQITVPKIYAGSLEQFAKKGGKLIVDGLTAFFDENMHNTMASGFDFEKLFGGNISEFKFTENIFSLDFEGRSLPAHLWKGYVIADAGKIIYSKGKDPIGLRNTIGKGEVLWIPSPLGLGSRIVGDYSKLCDFLSSEAKSALDQNSVMFKTPQKNTLMKTMKSGDQYITTIINKDKETHIVELEFKNSGFKPLLIYSSYDECVSNNSIKMLPEETKEIIWE
jgi:beta-galactosidase